MPDKARETKRMTANKRPLPKSLRKPISIDDVTGLAVQLGLPPGKADIERHVKREYLRAIKEFDAHFCKNCKPNELSERRAKAAIEIVYGIPADAPDWWAQVAFKLITKHIPAFQISEKSVGRSREWTIGKLFDLRRDLQKLKEQYPRLSVARLCQILKKRKDYDSRWDRYQISALRKAYTLALKLWPNPPELGSTS
jgi:hypothetical protein